MPVRTLAGMHFSNSAIALAMACALPATACSFVAKTSGIGLGDSSAKPKPASTAQGDGAADRAPAADPSTSAAPAQGPATPSASTASTPAAPAPGPVSAVPERAAPVAPAIALKPDDGFTGPVHEKFKGQFFFSSNEVSKTSSESAFSSSFDATKPIFTRVFLDGSWGNALRKEGIDCSYRLEQPYRSVRVQVNGGESIGLDWRKTHEDGFDEGTYYVLNNDLKAINHGPVEYPEAKDTSYRKWAGAVMPQLKVGENKLDFSAKAVCHVMNEGRKEVEVAKGAIVVTLKSEKDRQRWYKQKGPKLPKEKFRGGKKLHKQMKKSLAAKFGASEKAHNVSITSKDWYIKRNRISGRAVSRTLSAIVVLESPKYGCRGFDLSFTQQSLDGIRKYGDAMSIAVGSSHDLPCSTK